MITTQYGSPNKEFYKLAGRLISKSGKVERDIPEFLHFLLRTSVITDGCGSVEMVLPGDLRCLPFGPLQLLSYNCVNCKLAHVILDY